MLGIALVQIEYLPAYFAGNRDLLTVEGFACLSSNSPDLDKIRSDCADVFVETKRIYLERFEKKVECILREAHRSGARLVVMPEYSVPFELLPMVRRVARELNMLVVAGSHRVASGNDTTYLRLGFDSAPQPGTAVSPVFAGIGGSVFFTKRVNSKWEPDLDLPNEADTNADLAYVRFEGISVIVVLCIDALNINALQAAVKSVPAPVLVVCPSHSPSTDSFLAAAALIALNGGLLVYANAAEFGETCFGVKVDQLAYWRGTMLNVDRLTKGEEALLRADIELGATSPARGTAMPLSTNRRPWRVPIVAESDEVSKARQNLVAQCKRARSESKLDLVPAYMQDFLARLGNELSDGLHSHLNQLERNSRSLQLLSAEDLDRGLAVCLLESKRIQLEGVEVENLRRLQQRIVELLVGSDADTVAIGRIVGVTRQRIAVLGRKLPELASKPEGAPEPEMHGLRSVDDWSVARFQNRGTEFDRLEETGKNEEIRLVVISGTFGIGKSDFVRAGISKLFPSHSVIRLQLHDGFSASLLVAELGISFGLPFDVDAVERLDDTGFQQICVQVAAAFSKRTDTLVVMDDLAHLYNGGIATDRARLVALLHALSAAKLGNGSKVLMCWSGMPPDSVRFMPHIKHLLIKPLLGKFVRRIVERQAQHLKAKLEGARQLDIPETVVDALSGHPLSAIQLVEFCGLSRDIAPLVDPVAAQCVLARGSFDSARIDEGTRNSLLMLSCFRSSIDLENLRSIGYGELAQLAEELASRSSLVIVDEDGVRLHESVRRDLYRQLATRDEEHRAAHQVAASYYDGQWQASTRGSVAELSAVCEYVYHAASCGVLDRGRISRRNFLTQVKRSAREVYKRDKNYEFAYRAYSTAAEIDSGDPEIYEAMGRCLGRMRRWTESDEAFEWAIKCTLSRPTKFTPAWIYKSWGHIRARYEFYERARELFDLAEKAAGRSNDDPAIIAARAYILWQTGDTKNAVAGFDAAIDLDPLHKYSLTYFSKLLRQLGNTARATELWQRLQHLEGDSDPFSDESQIDADDE